PCADGLRGRRRRGRRSRRRPARDRRGGPARDGLRPPRLAVEAAGATVLLPQLLRLRGPARPRPGEPLHGARARAGADARRRRRRAVAGEPVARGDVPERRAARRRPAGRHASAAGGRGARRGPPRAVGAADGAAAASGPLRRRPGGRRGRVRSRRRAALPRERRRGANARASPCPARRARSMPIPVTGVSELVLEVEDLAAAERFYNGVLGLPIVERWAEREAIWVMAGDRTRIGLWRPQVGVA